MDLEIKDVAQLLNLPETKVEKWAKEGKIPAYFLKEQYRFSRIEIENWMMKRNLQEEGFFHREEKQIYPKTSTEGSQGGMQQFSLYRAIHRGAVYSEIAGNDKETLIRSAMQTLAPKLKSDAEVLSELLLDRERLMPTALNSGIAVPHARECLQGIPFDLVTVVFPEKPIEYGALDGKPVHTLFFLFAQKDKIHLHLLAKIAHLSSNPEALALLKARPEKSKLLEFVRNFELNLRV